MGIIRQQLGKIYHFLLILVLLLGLNVTFKLVYGWDGISVIVRTYIFVLIFYCVFLFSQLRYEELIDSYRTRYGWLGKFRLFFDIRLFPFLFAVFMTSLFVLVTYIDRPNWPYYHVLWLLDGKHSNTVFYALILYFILRMNMRPSIAIPLFIASCCIFWLLDRFLYLVIPYGRGIGIVKQVKYIIFIFIIVYDYSGSTIKLVKAALISVFTGVFLFFMVAGVVYGGYKIAGEDSPYASQALRVLLKAGFGCQYDNLRDISLKNHRPNDVQELIYYSGEYGRDINFDAGTWQIIIENSQPKNGEAIFDYLEKKRIMLDFNFLREYVDKFSKTANQAFSSSENFKKYFSGYFNDNREAFFRMFMEGDDTMKVWIVDCLAYSGSPEATGFLVQVLTGINRNAAIHAYDALKKITGKDPAGVMHKVYYDIDVINEFVKWREDAVRKSP